MSGSRPVAGVSFDAPSSGAVAGGLGLVPGCSAADFADAGVDARVEAIGELAGLLAAVQAVLGSLIVAADEARDWAADGALDVAAWLVARCGLTTPHAREWVRVAHALESLPALRGAFASGAVAWDQIRPVTRFATAETDVGLAERVPGLSAAQCEALARQHRPVPDDEAATARARRALWWRADHAAGGYRYHGFLPTDMAGTVNAVLSGMAERAGALPETGQWEPMAARCADALHDLCDDPARVRAAVDIHVPVDVDLEVLAGEEPGNGLVGHEMPVSRQTVLRYLCDADISHTIETPDGIAIGIGRRSQTIPRWLRRHITHRDRTCRFPGCERPIRHIHHARHWTAHRGPTDSPNLAGLCFGHHQLCHDGGWNVTGDANTTLTFTSPTGRQVSSTRQPIKPHTASRARALVALPEADPTAAPVPTATEPAEALPPPGRRPSARHPESTPARGAPTRPRAP